MMTVIGYVSLWNLFLFFYVTERRDEQIALLMWETCNIASTMVHNKKKCNKRERSKKMNPIGAVVFGLDVNGHKQ